MDSSVEKQALEAFCKERVTSIEAVELALKNPDRLPAMNADVHLWLAAWEARGRASGQQGVEGYKLVPVEPTEEMIKAVQGEANYPRARELIVADYRAMLAASPQITSVEQHAVSVADMQPCGQHLGYENPQIIPDSMYTTRPENAATNRTQWATQITSPDESVAIPKSEDQATLMVLLGQKWLHDNTPQLIKATQPSDSVQGWKPIEKTNDVGPYLIFNPTKTGVHQFCVSTLPQLHKRNGATLYRKIEPPRGT